MELRQGLRSKSKIEKWAGKYPVDEDTCIENLVSGVRERGCLTYPELVLLADWKLPDRWKRGEDEGKLGLVKLNSLTDVESFTRYAFFSTNHKESLGCLRRLSGVGRAVASAILHWFHKDPYPVWDVYARWSVSLNEYWDEYRNNDERWKAYVEFCRDKADLYEVDMRTFDRALFKYGEAKMPRGC